MIIRSLLVCSLLVLASCTGTAVVPPVTVDAPTGLSATPGNYAVTIQSGGWALTTKSAGHTCGAWKFDTDVNGSYETAIRDVLTRSLQKTNFVSDTYTPEKLKIEGMNAQVIVYQGNASSNFSVGQNLFSGTAMSQVELTVTLAIIDQNGLNYQQTISGTGSSNIEIFTCPKIGEAIGKAAQNAIRAVGKDIMLYVRDGLRERLLKTVATPQS
jgi:hypothetical protein